jgi:hypothetical protein
MGRLPEGLGAALNEATVTGLRPGAAGSFVLSLDVVALPEGERDDRRELVFSGVSRVRVLLRRDGEGDEPAIPLPDFAAVERFFASLSWSGTLYGWEFVDSPDLIGDWPEVVSLDVSPGSAPGTHTLYWFNECGRDGAWCIEGVIDFEDLTVQRLDGTSITVEDFATAGKRWWEAFFAGGEVVAVRNGCLVASRKNRPAVKPRWRW